MAVNKMYGNEDLTANTLVGMGITGAKYVSNKSGATGMANAWNQGGAAAAAKVPAAVFSGEGEGGFGNFVNTNTGRQAGYKYGGTGSSNTPDWRMKNLAAWQAQKLNQGRGGQVHPAPGNWASTNFGPVSDSEHAKNMATLLKHGQTISPTLGASGAGSGIQDRIEFKITFIDKDKSTIDETLGRAGQTSLHQMKKGMIVDYDLEVGLF